MIVVSVSTSVFFSTSIELFSLLDTSGMSISALSSSSLISLEGIEFLKLLVIFDILYNLKSSNRLIIYATHNRFFANMADCKLEMIGGKINPINARIGKSKI